MNKSHSQNKFEQIEERVVFSNQYVTLRNDLVRFPNGKIGEYVVIESNNFSGTLCYTKDKKLVMIKQFRYPWQKSSWEMSSGFIDTGETPKEAAIREVLEETGYRVINISPLIDCYPIGNNNSVGFLFFAEVEPSNSSFDTDEIEQVKEFTIREVDELIKKGEIIQGTTLLAYFYAKTLDLFK
jgi:ADP-ribose pyrophosphatase